MRSGGVQRPAHRDARTDVLDRLGRQLRKEPGRVAVGRAAEDAPALRVREVEPLHRAREADVAEPALLGQPVGVEGGALRREQAFLEADDENGRELEAFRRVQGHELHAIEAGRGLRLAGLERRMREEGVERREAFVVVRLESLGGVHELVEVLDARLALVVLLARGGSRAAPSSGSRAAPARAAAAPRSRSASRSISAKKAAGAPAARPGSVASQFLAGAPEAAVVVARVVAQAGRASRRRCRASAG